MEARSLSPQPPERPPLTLAHSSTAVSTIMITDVVTVKPDDRLYLVQHLLEHNGIHHLLVEDKRMLLGVISDRDMLSSVSPFLETEDENQRDTRTLHLRAHEIMTPRPVCVVPTTTIAQAATLLLQHNISCLPVVSPDRVIEGIVTWKDILWHYVEASGVARPPRGH